MRKKININLEELRLVMRDKTLDEASLYFGCSRKVIQERLREMGLNYYQLKHGSKPPLTQEQMDVLEGTMLGDANITPKGYYRYCQKKKPYCYHVRKKLSPYSSSIYYTKNGETGIWRFHTIVSPKLKSERHRWYPQGKKVVPHDLQLNNRSLAYWFMDDGTNCQRNRQVRLFTFCFLPNDVEFLNAQLSGMNLKCYINYVRKQPLILISCSSYFDFLDRVRPLVLPCMSYKTDITQVSEKKHEYRSFKLKGLAQAIRDEYATGETTQVALANKYKVKQCSIHQILTGKSYKSCRF